MQRGDGLVAADWRTRQVAELLLGARRIGDSSEARPMPIGSVEGSISSLDLYSPGEIGTLGVPGVQRLEGGL